MIDEFNKELYGRLKEHLFKVIEDVHKESEMTDEELENHSHDFICEIFQKMLLHTEPNMLLANYLEARTGVLFNDGIEDKFVAALESVTKFIEAGKTRAVVDKLTDDIYDELYEIKEVRIGNKAIMWGESRDKGLNNENEKP
jgi:glucokinase